jgi:hypothetical protein
MNADTSARVERVEIMVMKERKEMGDGERTFWSGVLMVFDNALPGKRSATLKELARRA